MPKPVWLDEAGLDPEEPEECVLMEQIAVRGGDDRCGGKSWVQTLLPRGVRVRSSVFGRSVRRMMSQVTMRWDLPPEMMLCSCDC